MDTVRLIYKSRAAAPIDQPLIEEIETVSARRNQALGITGLLLATRSHFLQVLEGDMAAVNQVYNDIVRDDRHRDILLISYQQITEREFGQWAMKGTGVSLMGRVIAGKLKIHYGEEDGELAIPLDGDLALDLLRETMYYLQGGKLR
jgi:hypothetical protein